MAHVLKDGNLFLVWSENFVFFTWKFNKSEITIDNEMKSSEFKLREDVEETSYLEMSYTNDRILSIYFHNLVKIKKGLFLITISDKEDSIIHCEVSSKNFPDSDLLQNFTEGLVSYTKYPITITCVLKNSDDNLSTDIPYSVSSIDTILLNSLREFSSHFKKVLNQDAYSDVTLNVGSDNIKAHKMILQARSPVFQKMFNNDLRQTAENKVVIADTGAVTVKILLSYLYTGVVEKCNFEQYLELFYAADKFEVISLRDICKMKLLDLLQVENACYLFALANTYVDEVLKLQVVKFISSNFKSVVDTKSFSELSKDDMTLLMRSCASVMKEKSK